MTGALRPLLDYRAALTAGEGVGRYVRELAAALAARGDCAPRLFGPTWAAPLGGALDGVPAGARLFRRRVPSKALTGALRAVRGRVEWFLRDAQLVHHTQYRRLPTALPEVAMIHDLVYLDSTALVRDPRVARRMGAFARGAARTSRALTTPSETVADEVAERLDVPRERVFATPLGVDHALRLPVDEGARARARARGVYLLTLARIEPRKNHLGVLRALESLGSAAPPWVVAGPAGADAGTFLDAVERSPLRGQIELLGRVSEADVRALIEGAIGMALVPFDEGFGLAPLEAMALGARVVTSDVPVVREVCGGGPAALCDPRDAGAIARAIAALGVPDPGARERGARHAGRFTWAAAAARTLDAYRFALGD